MLSARAGEEGTIEGLEAGADDYLIKPFAARELLARVHANLELDRVRRTRDQLRRSQDLLDQAQRLARVGSWEIDLATGAITALGGVAAPGRHDRRRAARAAGSRRRSQRRAPRRRWSACARRSRPRPTGAPLDVELRLVQPADGDAGGSARSASSSATRTASRCGLRGSDQDITEQRAAEQALAAAAAEREAAARERRIADELQRSLLPAALASTPTSSRSRPSTEPGVAGTQVGGDWYDVIELGAGRTALVIGDVMGRGVRAAAVMGQLRAAVRAYARLDLAPADVLEYLDGVVRELGDEQIVTCVYAVYDPRDRSLTYANAGHLPPLLVVDGEPPRRLDGRGRPAAGRGAGRRSTEERVALAGRRAARALHRRAGRAPRPRPRRRHRPARRAAGRAVDGPIDAIPAALVGALAPGGPRRRRRGAGRRRLRRSADAHAGRRWRSTTTCARSTRPAAFTAGTLDGVGAPGGARARRDAARQRARHQRDPARRAADRAAPAARRARTC